jgi:hypothetical protein
VERLSKDSGVKVLSIKAPKRAINEKIVDKVVSLALRL